MHARLIATPLFIALLTLPGCASPGHTDVGSDASLGQLVSWMTGSFSSAEQASSDSEFFDIRLEVAPIWTGRTDARWLYVEQAAASALDRPYRQRVYRVTESPDGTFLSAVYELPGEALDYAGAWRTPGRFDAIAPDELVEREGCAVVLAWDGEAFAGSTVDERCLSSLRGASYATSRVEIADWGMSSWDQGFDADGEQVWGARKGPYEFRRVGG